MVRRALDGKIKSELDAMGGTRLAQETKIVDGAERGMDGIVTTFVAANRVGTADVVGRDGQAVIFAFAIGRTDRMDRRQVEDIKSHLFDARQVPDDITERSVTVWVVGCRTRKQLIPSSENRLSTLDIERQCPLIPDAKRRLLRQLHRLAQIIGQKNLDARGGIGGDEPGQS